jgi:ABC-2 type transport system ATP-binding protein
LLYRRCGNFPRWARVNEVLDWVAGLHPKFNRAKAEARLKTTTVPMKAKINSLSKGMIVQVHLAIALAIDARILVLDEPTLGLDIVNRRGFYDAILSDFWDENRTVIITTHQVDEVEPILSHAIFIRDGEVTLDDSMDLIAERFLAVDVLDTQKDAAQALKPLYGRSLLGRTTFVFDGVSQETLKQFGEARRVGLADLFVALAQ